MTDLNYVEGLFLQAENAMEQGAFIDAKETLELLLSVDPSYGRAHHHMGWIYDNKIGENEKALYHYRLAVKFSPDFGSAHINYAYLLFIMGRLKDHEEVIGTALEIEGTPKAALINERGRSAEVQGAYKAAIGFYQAAVKESLSDDEITIYRKNIKRVRSKMTWVQRLM